MKSLISFDEIELKSKVEVDCQSQIYCTSQVDCQCEVNWQSQVKSNRDLNFSNFQTWRSTDESAERFLLMSQLLC